MMYYKYRFEMVIGFNLNSKVFDANEALTGLYRVDVS